jgi:predicted GNAT family acetyltransferase
VLPGHPVPMEARLHDDLPEFWELVWPLFATDPARHTVGISALRQTLVAPDPAHDPLIMLSIWDSGELVGAAFRLPPWPAWCSAVPRQAVGLAAATLLEAVPGLSGVVGPRDIAEPLADECSRLTGATVKETISSRLYRLAGLEVPVVPGRARRATEDDVALMAQWRVDFQLEAIGYEREPGRAEFHVRRSMAMGNGSFLWEVDGEAVSYAVAGDPAVGMSRIGPVYTPPAHRGKGYGSAVTAAVAQWAIDQGAENVVLFADLANPVSNSIYQRIGFRAVYDSTELEFHK